MENEIKDGGPAFPGSYHSGRSAHLNQGMTIRDYFAAKAIQGVVGTIGRISEIRQLSVDAYAIADAMLAAREGKV